MTTRNYTTLDPAATDGALAIELSGTALSTYTVGATATAHALYKKSTGVWYVEWVPFGNAFPGWGARVGVATVDGALAQRLGTATDDVGYDVNGNVYRGNSVVATGSAWGADDVIGVAVDFAAATVTFIKNGLDSVTAALTAATAYVPAASLWQGANDGSSAKVSLLLSSGLRRFEYYHAGSVSPGGYTGAGAAPNVGWFDLAPGIGSFHAADREWMSAPDDMPANVAYHDALAESGLVLTDSLTFWPWGSQTSSASTQLKLNNADGAYDALLAGDARDAEVTLRDTDAAGDLATSGVVARMVVNSVRADDDGGLTVALNDRSSRLERALQQRLILPTADDGAANKPWPWAVGAVRSAEAVALRAADQVYAVNDGPLAGIDKVRDRGDPFQPELGDYTLDQVAGTMTLADAAQGRVTLDFSTLGGSANPSPSDALGGIGAFDSATGWTLAAHWSISSSALRYSYGAAEGFVSAKTSSFNLTKGKTYKITFDVDRLGDTGWGYYGKQPAAAVYLTASGDDGTGKIDWFSAWGRIYPDSSMGLNVGTVALVGTARRNGPLHIGLFTGQNGATLVLNSVVLWEAAEESLDDELLVPATLEQALRELLESRAGLLATDWSAADAAAIDTATGYAGIGYMAPTAATPTIAQALDEILASYGACRYTDDEGVLRFVRIVAPESLVPTATIDASMLLDDPAVSLDLAANLTTQISGCKNWAPLEASEMVSDDVGLPYGLTGGSE